MAKKKELLERFYSMVEAIETAMFTTRRPDGSLVSRPMATQAQAKGADLWFVTDKDSPKLQEIRHDAHVNVAYFNARTKEWISVAGTAKIVTNRETIRTLYRPDWRAWFGSEGGGKHGTPDDPRMRLIGIRIDTAEFLEVNKPAPVILFEIAKGVITGNRPDLDPPKIVSGDQLRRKKPAKKK